VQKFVEVSLVLFASQTRWNVPEGDVGALWLIQNQFEARSVTDLIGEILGVVERLVDVSFQAVCSLEYAKNLDVYFR
jgi:hypothetical protein